MTARARARCEAARARGGGGLSHWSYETHGERARGGKGGEEDKEDGPIIRIESEQHRRRRLCQSGHELEGDGRDSGKKAVIESQPMQ